MGSWHALLREVLEQMWGTTRELGTQMIPFIDQLTGGHTHTWHSFGGRRGIILLRPQEAGGWAMRVASKR